MVHIRIQIHFQLGISNPFPSNELSFKSFTISFACFFCIFFAYLFMNFCGIFYRTNSSLINESFIKHGFDLLNKSGFILFGDPFFQDICFILVYCKQVSVSSEFNKVFCIFDLQGHIFFFLTYQNGIN